MNTVLPPVQADTQPLSPPLPPPTLLIACGALARELLMIIKVNGWTHMDVTCLPAKLHNTPDAIPDAMREKIRRAKETNTYAQILAVYADCGTGGMLDKVLEEENIERIDGPHCYQFFATEPVFERLMEEEIGTFFLTDYMVRQFDTVILKSLGLDKHPDLMEVYFHNYTKLVYLSQDYTPALGTKAEGIARTLGCVYEHVPTGMGGLQTWLTHHHAAPPQHDHSSA